MATCLVTTLKEAVGDNSLAKLDEVVFSVKSNNVACVRLGINSAAVGTTLRVIGDGYITNETGTSNLGKTASMANGVAVYLSPGGYNIAINNKNYITAISTPTAGIVVDTESLLGLPALNWLVLDSATSTLYGDTKYFKYTSINYFKYHDTNAKITGKFSDFVGMHDLLLNAKSIEGTTSDFANVFSPHYTETNLAIGGSSVTGNISAFGNITNLAVLYVYNTNVEGNISSLSGLTKLRTLDVSNTNVVGDTSSLAGLTNLTTFLYTNTAITGTWPLT